MKYGVQIAAICTISMIGFIVYVSQSGCGCYDTDEEKFTVQIGSPEITTRLSGEEVIWDATLPILKVTPKDEKARWTDVKVVVKSADGSVLNELSQLQPYPTDITDSGVGDADIQLWFVDATGDGIVSAGDKILVTCMNGRQYEGALLQLVTGGHLIGDARLPTDFP